MKRIQKKVNHTDKKESYNPIVQMIEDKGKIAAAIKKGDSLSTLKGIKIVSPLVY